MKYWIRFGLALLAFTFLLQAETATPPFNLYPKDIFVAGSQWEGSRRGAKEDARPRRKRHNKKQNITLVITERDGETFKGKITLDKTMLGNDFASDVTGKAFTEGEGPISFVTEKQGDFRQSFHGKVRGGVMELEFHGKSMAGEQIEGVAVLEPKSE